jgi:hypothetical protein
MIPQVKKISEVKRYQRNKFPVKKILEISKEQTPVKKDIKILKRQTQNKKNIKETNPRSKKGYQRGSKVSKE